MAAEWIEKRKAQQEQDKQETKISEARERLAIQTIGTDGPVFWDALLPELTNQCADMKELGFRSMAYFLENQFCPEEKTYHIDIQTEGHWPVDAHASLIYFTGSSQIRINSNIPKLTEISLCVTERGIRAVSNKEMSMMNVKALAAYLLEGLVEATEKQSK